MSSDVSFWESIRKETVLPLPNPLKNLQHAILEPLKDCTVADEIASLFPHISKLPLLKGKNSEKKQTANLKIGVVFSGGQAPGGHNVLAGLFDAIEKLGKGELIGFLGGPSGIISGSYKPITEKEIDAFRNKGGFHLLGSGRTKIESEDQLKNSLEICQKLLLDGLVIVGGDDSNTNAAVLAEYFAKNGSNTTIVGVPKTIDGDLKNSFVSLSFGFDSATKLYSELIGNLAQDALSAKKYTHFIRLMGRSASHITLECALATHPNLALIAEEVAAKKLTLQDIILQICDLVEERGNQGKLYSVILIPEGLIEFIPDVAALIAEINCLLALEEISDVLELEKKLSQNSLRCFSTIPTPIQKQLLLDRDPHGNVQLSLIETERLIIEMVSRELKKRGFKGFHPIPHFFGYEGRSGFPSNFDACYCYALGQTAALLVRQKASGYMCFVSDLERPVSDWGMGGVPLPSLMHMEMRKGKRKPVIQKALVDLEGKAFKLFAKERNLWKMQDCYRVPGPMQFEKDFSIPLSLSLEKPGEE